MITITNRKIAGLEPRWASFKGFSLLFDNPGDSTSMMDEGLLKADCRLNGNGDLRLYKGLVEFLSKAGKKKLTNTYLLCPLPPNSYHVTAWDGLNDGNVETILPSYRQELESFLSNLPESLLTDNEFVKEVNLSPMVTSQDWSITFKFDKLAILGNEMLVACLVAADRDSEKELERLVEYREALSATFQKQFGAKMRSDYYPHVTLGYFANEKYVVLANNQVNHWTKLVKRAVNDLSIVFNSISPYGFTDMATFFKRSGFLAESTHTAARIDGMMGGALNALGDPGLNPISIR